MNYLEYKYHMNRLARDYIIELNRFQAAAFIKSYEDTVAGGLPYSQPLHVQHFDRIMANPLLPKEMSRGYYLMYFSEMATRLFTWDGLTIRQVVQPKIDMFESLTEDKVIDTYWLSDLMANVPLENLVEERATLEATTRNMDTIFSFKTIPLGKEAPRNANYLYLREIIQIQGAVFIDSYEVVTSYEPYQKQNQLKYYINTIRREVSPDALDNQPFILDFDTTYNKLFLGSGMSMSQLVQQHLQMFDSIPISQMLNIPWLDELKVLTTITKLEVSRSYFQNKVKNMDTIFSINTKPIGSASARAMVVQEEARWNYAVQEEATWRPVVQEESRWRPVVQEEANVPVPISYPLLINSRNVVGGSSLGSGGGTSFAPYYAPTFEEAMHTVIQEEAHVPAKPIIVPAPVQQEQPAQHNDEKKTNVWRLVALILIGVIGVVVVCSVVGVAVYFSLNRAPTNANARMVYE